MSSRRRMGRLQRFFWQLLKQFMQAVLRLLFRFTGRRTAEAGFVFPTTVLLVLMVSLTAGALTYRAFSRSTQVIVERQQQVVQNAATPAIDRAKAKLEYVFSAEKEDRPKPIIPPSNALENLLRAQSANMLTGGVYDNLKIRSLPEDIYTLEDEERVDLDNDGKQDNAWVFRADINGDGTIGDEFVIYSIFVDHLRRVGGNDVGYDSSAEDKAAALIARNSPLTATAEQACVVDETSGTADEPPISGEGWSRITSAKIEKTLQVDVLAVDLTNYDPSDPSSAQRIPIDTLEFQQVREASTNKWGAWFRYDLEATPGPEFNWNGAIHTQGSLFIANNFNAYMISSTESCAYDDEASDITLGAYDDDTQFKGQFVRGNADIGFRIRDGSSTRGEEWATIHVEDNGDPKNPQIVPVEKKHETITDTTGSIIKYYLDPIALHLRDEYQHVDYTGNTPGDPPQLDDFGGRISNVADRDEVRVSLDDTFRADDRYGPESTYSRPGADLPIPGTTDIGVNINSVEPADDETLIGVGGLDGYWERRAVDEGARLIVGQRLELGNVYGWNHDPFSGQPGERDLGDPLYPPTEVPLPASATSPPRDPGLSATRTGETYQRKSLRDNLAAVQGMVVYHYETSSGTVPAVCVATTAHYGTYPAIANSRTFRELRSDPTNVMTDFLTGNGTNGWQFEPVVGSTFNVGTGARALTNLANFAGDADGGAPSFTPLQNNVAHPFPYKAMWGDFSMLRRVQASGNGSIADDSTIDTVACTLSLLAYNIKSIKEEYDSYNTPSDWLALANAFEAVAAANLDSTAIGSGDRTPQPFSAWFNSATLSPAQQLQARAAATYWGMEYSRAFGFANKYGLPAARTQTLSPNYDPDDGSYTTAGATFGDPANTTYNVGCDPNMFVQGNHGGGGGVATEEDALALALALCPSKLQQPQWPALFYIFPYATHAIDPTASLVIDPGTYAGNVFAAVGGHNYSSFPGDDNIYGRDATAPASFVSRDFNTEDYVDQVVNALGETPSFDGFTYAEIEGLAATPLAPGSWVVASSAPGVNRSFEPTGAATANFVGDDPPEWNDANSPDAAGREWDLVIADTAGDFDEAVGAPIIDKVIYSGRENLAVRLLDINVDTFMQDTNPSGANNWFATQDSNGDEHFGLTYAFREDALREDTIVRPDAGLTSATCNNYNVYAQATNPSCQARVFPDVMDWTDPPLGDRQISVKPVDYVPDPMRKPYGFRLRNGRNFNRQIDHASGLTFISNNAVAIQGDFNLHTKATTALEEEFTDRQVFTEDPGDGDRAAGDFYKAFYERQTVNTDFARYTDASGNNNADDNWRPAEVLGDAVYLFSGDFKDGFVEPVFVAEAANAPLDTFQFQTAKGQGLVSFQNINRPVNRNRIPQPDGGIVQREDLSDPNSAIYIDRNGEVYFDDGDTLAAKNYLYTTLGLVVLTARTICYLRRRVRPRLTRSSLAVLVPLATGKFMADCTTSLALMSTGATMNS
ncbi:MAG: hormogonium polysaccharide biosynthesis protein HpsA [Cyanobacteria bacterium J06636_16]